MIQHIDSIIQIFFGLLCTWLGFRQAGNLSLRARKILRFCGPALIAIGSVLMIAKNNLPATWHRHVSSDGLASAEFPAVVEARELSDKAGEVTVRRTSFNYNVPGKDMSLFFSFSPVPGESRGLPDDQYIDQTIAVLASQGSTLVGREQAQGSPIHRLTFRNDAHKANIVIAVAYRNGNAYRIVASWTDGSEDDELIRRFTGSFRVEAGDKNQ